MASQRMASQAAGAEAQEWEHASSTFKKIFPARVVSHMGLEPRSSGRTASTLQHQAIFQAVPHCPPCHTHKYTRLLLNTLNSVTFRVFNCSVAASSVHSAMRGTH